LRFLQLATSCLAAGCLWVAVDRSTGL
jgi:hypothetical protein